MDNNKFYIDLDKSSEQDTEKEKVNRFNGVEVVVPKKREKKPKSLYTFLDMSLIKNFRKK